MSSLGTSMTNLRSYALTSLSEISSPYKTVLSFHLICKIHPTGAGDLTGDAMGYVTGVLAVLIHAAYLVLIQKTSVDSEYGPQNGLPSL